MASPGQLSFLPDDYLERKRQRRANAICGMLFLCVVGGMGAAFTFSERATRRIDEEHAAVEKQYVAEARRLEQVKQMHEKQKRMAQQADLTASLLERVPRSFVLAEITNCLPAGVSLLDFTLEAKPRAKKAPEAPKTAFEQRRAARQPAAAAAPAAPEPKLYDVRFELTGVAHDDVQVAAYLRRLGESKLFKDVNLLITEEKKIKELGDQVLRQFKFEMMLNPDASASDRVAKTNSTTSVLLSVER
jgi:Tfp pilus assembly protein PilN